MLVGFFSAMKKVNAISEREKKIPNEVLQLRDCDETHIIYVCDVKETNGVMRCYNWPRKYKISLNLPSIFHSKYLLTILILSFPYDKNIIQSKHFKFVRKKQIFPLFSFPIDANVVVVVVVFKKLKMASIYFVCVSVSMCVYVCVYASARHIRLTYGNATEHIRCVVSLKNVNKQMHETTLFVTHKNLFFTYIWNLIYPIEKSKTDE